MGIGLGLSLPDIVYRGFGFWLGQRGKAVEHIHGFVLPAALMAGLRKYLIHGSPEPHGTISDGQFRRIHATVLELDQNLAPALSAFAHAVLNRQKLLFATGRHPNDNKGTELVILTPKAAVNAVSPDVDDWFVVHFRRPPVIVFVGPIAL